MTYIHTGNPPPAIHETSTMEVSPLAGAKHVVFRAGGVSNVVESGGRRGRSQFRGQVRRVTETVAPHGSTNTTSPPQQ